LFFHREDRRWRGAGVRNLESWENFCEQWFDRLTMSGFLDFPLTMSGFLDFPLILSLVERSKNFD